MIRKITFVILSIFLVACGNTKTTFPASSNANPQSFNSPTPAPTATPTPANPLWNAVREQTTCEAMNPAACQGAYGFTVDNAGRWTAGPDPNGITDTGTVTPAELNELNAAANAVASNDPNGPATCVPQGTVPGVSDDVALALPDGTDPVIYHKSGIPKETCYRGGPDNARRLHTDMNGLMVKYYPRPFP